MRRLQIIDSFDSVWNGHQAILVAGSPSAEHIKSFRSFFFFSQSVRRAFANKISSPLGAREEERKTQGTEREHRVSPSGLCSASVALVSDTLPLRDNHGPRLQNSRTKQSTTIIVTAVNVHSHENTVTSSSPYTWSEWVFQSSALIFSSLNHQEIIHIFISHWLNLFDHFIYLSSSCPFYPL